MFKTKGGGGGGKGFLNNVQKTKKFGIWGAPYLSPFFWVGRTRLNGIISPPYPEVRGATRHQLCSFFEHRSKRGGDQNHVQKFWRKFCMILKAFLQHKIDMSQIGGKISKY